MIGMVISLLWRLPHSFVEELERDLRNPITLCIFLTIVHACIRCSGHLNSSFFVMLEVQNYVTCVTLSRNLFLCTTSFALLGS